MLISKVPPENKDAIALGLFYTGQKLAYYNDKSLASEYLSRALAICNVAPLRKSLEDILQKYDLK